MTKRVKLSAVLLVACAFPSFSHAAPYPQPVPRYEKFEATFSIPGMKGNPYDPSQNDVDAVFSTSRRDSVIVPAFWDGTTWRVRFTPTVVGPYHLSLTYNGGVLAPSDLSADSFKCVASTDHGFIHRDPIHSERFVFSDGTPYYPFGADYAWQNGGQADYPEGLAKFGANGMNWARIWMNPWDNKNLEWAGG